MTLFLLASSLGLCASGKPQFSIQISVPGTTYAAGAEVDIDVAITNLSDSAMPMPLETTPPVIVGCEFVFTRSGSGLEGAVEMTPYLWAMKRLTGRLSEKERAIAFNQNISPGILHGGEVELSPGQTIHYTALLNDLYKIATPGTYNLRAIYYGTVDALEVPARSNVLTFVINPPPSPSISIKIATVSGALTFKAFADIEILTDVRNDSAHPVMLPVPESSSEEAENGYRFVVSRKTMGSNGGSSVEKTGDYRINDQWEDYNHKYRKLTIVQPGQSIRYQAANLSKMFVTNVPGSYAVHVEKVDPVTHVAVQSNTINIEVR